MTETQAAIKGVHLAHRHKAYDVFVLRDGTLALYVDRCLRKDRRHTGKEPQYVWTNIELEWEEHHYIEAKYWQTSNRLLITVNGETAFEGEPPEVSVPDWFA